MATKYFTLIAGLPGSGKTYLAKSLQEKYGGFLVDDPKNMDRINEIPEDADLIYITDPYFCLSNVRRTTEKRLYEMFPGCAIAWIFLENNPAQCRENVKVRNDGREVEGSIRRFSKEFSSPANSPLLPCYRDEESFREMVERIKVAHSNV